MRSEQSTSNSGDACPFCRIPERQPEEIAARNEHCYLLGHPAGVHPPGWMIIPFRHIETPFEFSPAEWSAIQPLIAEAKSRLDPLNPDGFNLGWNVEKTGGQEVFHMHLHVFARFADEPFAGKGIRHWFKSAENERP